MARTSPVFLGVAGAAAIVGIAVMATAPQAAAQSRGGLLGSIFNIFGDSHDGRYAPVTAYAAPTVTPPDKPRDLQSPPAVSQGGGTTYCVRLCDGRYFPLSSPIAGSRASAAKTCSAMCPAASTAIFRGGDNIDTAYGERGEHYANLAYAFVYRERLVADCTCNGHDTFGLAPIDVATDPTLRAGDIVVTRSGLQAFRGSRGDTHKSAEFTPIRSAFSVSADTRRMLAGMRVSHSE
jgi:hypothetical protein